MFDVCRCEEIPVGCATALSNTYYAPGTSLIDAEPEAIMSEIQGIHQIPELAMCEELINTLNCLISYPVCSVNMKRLKPICQSQCEMITNLVTTCLRELSSHNFPIVNEILHTGQACENPENYYIFPSKYISDSSNPSDCLTISK